MMAYMGSDMPPSFAVSLPALLPAGPLASHSSQSACHRHNSSSGDSSDTSTPRRMLPRAGCLKESIASPSHTGMEIRAFAARPSVSKDIPLAASRSIAKEMKQQIAPPQLTHANSSPVLKIGSSSAREKAQWPALDLADVGSSMVIDASSPHICVSVLPDGVHSEPSFKRASSSPSFASSSGRRSSFGNVELGLSPFKETEPSRDCGSKDTTQSGAAGVRDAFAYKHASACSLPPDDAAEELCWVTSRREGKLIAKRGTRSHRDDSSHESTPSKKRIPARAYSIGAESFARRTAVFRGASSSSIACGDTGHPLQGNSVLNGPALQARGPAQQTGEHIAPREAFPKLPYGLGPETFARRAAAFRISSSPTDKVGHSGSKEPAPSSRRLPRSCCSNSRSTASSGTFRRSQTSSELVAAAESLPNTSMELSHGDQGELSCKSPLEIEQTDVTVRSHPIWISPDDNEENSHLMC